MTAESGSKQILACCAEGHTMRVAEAAIGKTPKERMKTTARIACLE